MSLLWIPILFNTDSITDSNVIRQDRKYMVPNIELCQLINCKLLCKTSHEFLCNLNGPNILYEFYKSYFKAHDLTYKF